MSDEAYQILEEYASKQNTNPSAVLASFVQFCTEWYIPGKSFDPISMPKKMLGGLFEMIDKESIDRITEQWAVESRNLVLLAGSSFTVETAIAFTYKVSKYFMGADAKLIKSKDKDSISFIIRHDGGEKFSYFCARCFYHFYNFFPLKRVIVNHDATSVYIEVDLVEDEVESMKRYLETIHDDIKKVREEKRV
ncbi:MAG TPA: hypothetical protein VLA68_06350 [Nitrososphaera sp.]|nr:hypothetical protein [Nitrososphaera sp.]